MLRTLPIVARAWLLAPRAETYRVENYEKSIRPQGQGELSEFTLLFSTGYTGK
jgi:hypothetical protein